MSQLTFLKSLHMTVPLRSPPSRLLCPLPPPSSFPRPLLTAHDRKSDFDEAKSGDGLIVIDFMATWCGPCKVIAPAIVAMSDTFPDIRFYKVDVDELPDVSHEYNIRAMPTFLILKNGEPVGEVVGANQRALEAAVRKEIEA